MKGCIHIYCGDGKGKTSAAIGLAVRAAGRGMKVTVVRFLKTDDSGEVMALSHIPGIQVMPCDKTFGFVFQMTPEQKVEAAAYFSQRFSAACKKAVEDGTEVLILDEMMAACRYGMVPEGDVVDFLLHKPESMEVVMTGRDPSERILALADYVSEIRMVRHPFEKGVCAREGIEY